MMASAKGLAQDVKRLLAHRRAPLVILLVIVVYSAGARMLYLGEPCTNPCSTGADHDLIFDEAYYVNAARVIDRIKPPAGLPYADAPLGKDPNAEHPQLAKLVVAGGIKVFGDGPWGWRIGSVLFGLIAIVAIYALVRAARGSPWLAVAAAGVMALDTLMLVHGRIATLDVYAVALMIVAATFYLREAPLRAGLVLGLAACMKLVALYLLPVLLLLEASRVLRAGRHTAEEPAPPWTRTRVLATTAGAGVVTAILGIWLMDLLVPAYDPGTHATYAGNPFRHIEHMVSYATKLKAIPNATGISSTPWQWLLDQKPIDYSRVAVNAVAGGKVVASRALVAFRGEVNPFILFLTIPAVFAAVAAAWRDRVAALGAAWCVGAFVPFVVESEIFHRLSYLYYLLVVTPGIYVVTAWLMTRRGIPTAARVGWAVAMLYGFVDLYPIRSLSGH